MLTRSRLHELIISYVGRLAVLHGLDFAELWAQVGTFARRRGAPKGTWRLSRAGEADTALSGDPAEGSVGIVVTGSDG